MTEVPVGQITTFYSFKGGVGRTMAVANVAFLAAMNGLRVLVMDWDLEAPGLTYYFRGLPDQEQARALRGAPGILDLAWQWKSGVEASEGVDDFDALLRSFRSGEYFSRCTRCVIDPVRLPDGAKLEVIGAGSQIVNAAESEPYAEALAHFSWTEFFASHGGGLFIDSLRTWAKGNYDIILVDSRTGYADVAGICTIQLPDVVALTFIFNRQNIEGIAQVASSVKAARNEEVRLRAAPMRLSREGTLEEADARSRAIRNLQRGGAFTADEVERDMELLSVRAAPSVPFYETLAPFAVASPTTDQLTLDYVALAQEICGRRLALPEIPIGWRESVRRRLEPKLATVSYLSELKTADPARAIDEIDRLIDGALEAELHEGGVDREYILALVSAAFDLDRMAGSDLDLEQIQKIPGKALGLLRAEFESDPEAWRVPLADYLERYNALYAFPNDEGEFGAQYEELDDLLNGAEQTTDIILRRARYKRLISSVNRPHDPARALAVAEETERLLSNIPLSDKSVEVAASRADTLLQKSMAAAANGNAELARAAAHEGLVWIHSASPPSALTSRVKTELHVTLAGLETDPEIAADHGLQAIGDESHSPVLYRNIELLTRVLTQSELAPTRSLALIPVITGTRTRTRSPPHLHFSRSIQLANTYAVCAAQLASSISALPDARESIAALEALVTTCTAILISLKRRVLLAPYVRGTKKQGLELLTALTALLEIAIQTGVSEEVTTGLSLAISDVELTGRPESDRSR